MVFYTNCFKNGVNKGKFVGYSIVVVTLFKGLHYSHNIFTSLLFWCDTFKFKIIYYRYRDTSLLWSWNRHIHYVTIHVSNSPISSAKRKLDSISSKKLWVILPFVFAKDDVISWYMICWNIINFYIPQRLWMFPYIESFYNYNKYFCEWHALTRCNFIFLHN